MEGLLVYYNSKLFETMANRDFVDYVQRNASLLVCASSDDDPQGLRSGSTSGIWQESPPAGTPLPAFQ